MISGAERHRVGFLCINIKKEHLITEKNVSGVLNCQYKMSFWGITRIHSSSLTTKTVPQGFEILKLVCVCSFHLFLKYLDHSKSMITATSVLARVNSWSHAANSMWVWLKVNQWTHSPSLDKLPFIHLCSVAERLAYLRRLTVYGKQEPE